MKRTGFAGLDDFLVRASSALSKSAARKVGLLVQVSIAPTLVRGTKSAPGVRWISAGTGWAGGRPCALEAEPCERSLTGWGSSPRHARGS